MPYTPLTLRNTVSINRLYSLYYFYLSPGHVFPGERHNFWEMVYVDHGEVEIGTDDTVYRLCGGQLAFHKPNEFHRFIVGAPGSSLLVVAFGCTSAAIRQMACKRCTLDTQEKRTLALLRQEGELCFGTALDSAWIELLKPLESAPLGSQQMIRVYLEQLIILLLRDLTSEKHLKRQTACLTEESAAAALVSQITQFMQAHIDGSLCFDDIRRAFGASATSLKTCFKEQTGMGVMEYYQHQRVNEARRMLRAGALNVTQTSEALGYSSIHAFSRQFRRLMGMSPTEYLESITYET